MEDGGVRGCDRVRELGLRGTSNWPMSCGNHTHTHTLTHHGLSCLAPLPHPLATLSKKTTPQRVYQFHKDETGRVKEEHVLGRFDQAATAGAAKRDELKKLTDGGRAWQRQWQLEQAAVKHSSGAAAGSAASAAAATSSKGKPGDKKAAAAKQAKHDGKGKEDGKQEAAAGDGDGGKAAASSSPPLPPPMLEILDYLPDTGGCMESYVFFS